jgi:hypothetical protein
MLENVFKNDTLKVASAAKKNNIFYSMAHLNVVFAKVPEKEMSVLSAAVDEVQKEWNAPLKNKSLAGHVRKEYSLVNIIPDIENYILTLASEYDKIYNITPKIFTKNLPYSLGNLWVNFQKKYEFNPPHIHDGVMSFVIWHKIPYDLKEEIEIFDSNVPQTSCFGFLYTNNLGDICSLVLPINKEYESIMCLFPSKLMHYVNPFYTSDDYRISISGNIYLDSSI